MNKRQLAVVRHAAGPMLVIAGAGTGKTRVIVERIARLIGSGTAPNHILALTFTEKAAAEMLDRTNVLLGTYEVEMPVMTFNAFGESILREFNSHIGLGRNFRVLSEQAQIVFVRERIAALKLDYFLPMSDLPDSVIKDLVGVFSQLKQHVVTPATYRAWAAALSEAGEAQQFDKHQHVELAGAYEAYIKLCRQENVIDYDDQIYLVLELLDQRPNIKQLLQDRYEHIFVDEFQDTNPMQSRLIDQLVNDHQNLIVVGDDDQSIYGFRGATLQNILEFKDRYPNASEVALTQNYRSAQSILDAAYSLIKHNDPHRLESTLSINKRLTSSQPGDAPQLKRFETPSQELEWIANDITSRIEAGESPGSMAVLARSRKTVQAVHQALEQAGIAHRVIGASEDLYSRPLVRTLIELCRTLAEPDNSASLHHTLASPLFDISNDVLAPLATHARHNHEKLADLLAASTSEEAAKAVALLVSLREQAASLSVGRLLWRAIVETGYKDRLLTQAMKDDEAAQSLQHLNQYFQALRDFESIAIQPTAVEYLVSLPALQAAGETTEDGTLAIGDDEVAVLTVHKAKGLEWETVYIPACNEQSFPSKKQSGGLQIPEALKAATESLADEHYAEERRLMYVAVTRARQSLVLSFSDKNKSGGARKPSRFLHEMFGAEVVENTARVDTVGGQQSLLDMPTGSAPKMTLPGTIFDGERFLLSVSQASVLLDCPLNFYYKFVLHAPEDPTPRTAYGSQLHALFEVVNKAHKDGSKLALKDLITDLESGWDKSGYATKEQQERAFAQAKKTLTAFYQESATMAAPILVEEKFTAELEPEHIVLRGRYDVVLNNEDGIEIRDYKTGTKVKSVEKAKDRARSSNQLMMYALAWQLRSGELPTSCSLHFVDTGVVGNVRKTERGIDGLRSRLAKATTAIQAGHYEPGNKHDYCLHPPV